MMSKKQKLAEMAARIKDTKAKLARLSESKKKVEETKAPTLGLDILIESVVERSEVVIATKAIADKIQRMAEDTAKLQATEVMNLVDPIKEHFGPEVANKFEQAAIAQLGKLSTTLRSVKDALGAEVTRMETIINGGSGTDMEMDAPAAPADDTLSLDADAPEMADDAAAVPAPEGDPMADAGEMPELDLGTDGTPTDADPQGDESIASLFKDEGNDPAGRPRRESVERSGAKALRESIDPDALVLKCFRRALKESRDATRAARATARFFEIDVDDVVEIVTEASKKPVKESKKSAKKAVKESAEMTSDVTFADRSIARDVVDHYVNRSGIRVNRWEMGKVNVTGPTNRVRELAQAIRMKELYPDSE